MPKFYALDGNKRIDVTTHLTDDDPATQWHIKTGTSTVLLLDLQKQREFSALVIDWPQANFADAYDVLISSGGTNWDTVYRVNTGGGGKRFIHLPDQEGRYIKFDFARSAAKRVTISGIEVKNIDFAPDANALYSRIAGTQPRGRFPRYFYDEASYWTVVGVNRDTKEALINADGMVEVDKSSFSIEPFVFVDSSLVTWNDVALSQSLQDEYLPIPSVWWNHAKFILSTEVFADGAADSSGLFLRYTLKNAGPDTLDAVVFLALRPFQVNPPYQFLNTPGGVAKLKSINFGKDGISLNQQKQVIPMTPPQAFGCASFDEGDISEFLAQGILPENKRVDDMSGRASAALKYAISLPPSASRSIYIAIPFHPGFSNALPADENIARHFQSQLAKVNDYWRDKTGHVVFDLPASADKLIRTLRSNLAYILINRDAAGIQPGSRSYERSWIRDGALTSSALLKMGMKKEVREFLDWYSTYQYADGKIPCVVDTRGPDPVPENDSNGEYIFALLQYFHFTGDTTWLRDNFPHVQQAVNYLDSLIALRSTDYYKNGGDSLRAFYGLLPESISHEGYSDHPRHSYWDDFFAMKGLKDAVRIAEILHEHESVEKFRRLRDAFKTNLYNSIQLAIENHDIDYIPGCVELGDFDATSTTIALLPCNERDNLPQPYLSNTFNRYFQFAQDRFDPAFQWLNYTPYELRTVGTFIYLNQPQRAHRLLEFFFADQRPAGWNHWAEVVWREPKTAKFIGDMPHTWVGSDYINAVRSFFAYEDELADALVVGAGFYPQWFDSPNGFSFQNLPTYYGELNFSCKKEANDYFITVSGDLQIPKGGVCLRNWFKAKDGKVFVNG
ncbi:MAG: coagulation factor 5/8 type domain-containing protein, partial [Calditrichaeota bacterium]